MLGAWWWWCCCWHTGFCCLLWILPTQLLLLLFNDDDQVISYAMTIWLDITLSWLNTSGNYLSFFFFYGGIGPLVNSFTHQPTIYVLIVKCHFMWYVFYVIWPFIICWIHCWCKLCYHKQLLLTHIENNWGMNTCCEDVMATAACFWTVVASIDLWPQATTDTISQVLLLLTIWRQLRNEQLLLLIL